MFSDVEYMISIETLEGGGDFRPYVNIIGQKGNTGYRASAMNISEVRNLVHLPDIKILIFFSKE